MRIRFGECLLDSETRELYVRGEAVHVQPKAFQFLELLLEHRPGAVSKSQIHERLWPGTFVSDSTLTSLLVEVRDAIGDEARNPHYVRTVHGFGYAFCGSARGGARSGLARPGPQEVLLDPARPQANGPGAGRNHHRERSGRRSLHRRPQRLPAPRADPRDGGERHARRISAARTALTWGTGESKRRCRWTTALGFASAPSR